MFTQYLLIHCGPELAPRRGKVSGAVDDSRGRTDRVLGSNFWDQAGGSIFLCFDSPSSNLVRGTVVFEVQDLSSRALLVHVPSQRHEYGTGLVMWNK